VDAPTLQEAARAAVGPGYAEIMKAMVGQSKELQELAGRVATIAADTKAIKTKILSQKKTPNGYTVEVEITQSPDQIAEDLRNVACSNFRLVALMPELVDGERQLSGLVETSLIRALREQRFHVYDWNFVANENPLKALVDEVLLNNKDAATRLGTHFLANVIVAGRVEAAFSEDNEGIISHRASVNLKVFKVDNGEILASKTFEEKGFGNTKQKAARAALNNLAKKVATELPAEMVKNFDTYPVTVRLALSNTNQSEMKKEVNKVRTFLLNLPGVMDVQQAQTPDGFAFHVRSKEKPAALGVQIEQGGEYKVQYGRENQ
jgi:hypothetical protein